MVWCAAAGAVSCVVAWMTLSGGPESGPPLPTTVTIRVVLPDGQPAAGVRVGHAISRPAQGDTSKVVRALPFNDGPALTDANGEFVLERRFLFDETHIRPRVVAALSEDQSLIGLGEVTTTQADAGQPVIVRLAPSCLVSVRAHSTELSAMGRPPSMTHLYVWRGDLRPVGIEGSRDGKHEFLLPAGDFRLFVYGTDTSDRMVPITIAPGDKERRFEVDLRASRIARLIGKDAPELRSIKGWKNGGPVTLAELKGKVVLLDFWGTWCGPCIGAMPELMELHEKYKDDGLVIIAVHDDSTDSIATMEEKLAEPRRKHWGGKDLPFLVALDGGGECPIEGTDNTASGATTAAYGINTFPTQILIGRDGKVIGLRRRGDADQVPELMKQGAR